MSWPGSAWLNRAIQSGIKCSRGGAEIAGVMGRCAGAPDK